MSTADTTRPPIISVMGHIDHGKSTLLDTIREANTAEHEAGGITQHLAAYEIEYNGDEGKTKITFLDTPGHEAFISLRQQGATVADIAILVVAADEGVEEQTKETITAIKGQGIPFVVAFNKMDKSEADSDMVKQELAEQEVYVEGFGGDIPYKEISAKTGAGIGGLLDLIVVQAQLLELTFNPDQPAEGTVLESAVDAQRGIEATLVIQDGSIETGMHVHADGRVSPVRILENFRGERIESATASAPVGVVGFDEKPAAGSQFTAFTDKSAAHEAAEDFSKDKQSDFDQPTDIPDDVFTIPVIVKADVAGTIDAVVHEIKKLHSERAVLQIVNTGVGDITEDDIRAVAADDRSGIALGFNVSATTPAQNVADRRNVDIKTAPVIYKLVEWLKPAVKKRTPTITTREVRGRARILKNFSSKKDMQVVGGEVFEGKIMSSAGVTIYRNETEIAEGEIIELQQQRAETNEVAKGNEFGANIRSRIDIAPGDVIEAYEMVEK